MGASTRAALQAIRDHVGSSPELSVEVVAGICAAGRAIASYPSLLQGLTDRGHTVAERSTLVRSALSKASNDVLAEIEFLVTLTWSAPADFLAGIEEFAVRTAAKVGGSSSLAGELLQTSRVIRQHSEVQLALSDKRAKPEAKIALVEKLFQKKVSPMALVLIAHLVGLPRGKRGSEALRQAAALVSDQQGQGLAEVRVATELSGAQEKSVREMLHKRFGRDHFLDVVVDGTIIGGLRIRVGDVVIDATAQKQLNDMRLQLAG